MNLKLQFDERELGTPAIKYRNNGVQYIFVFENGYGASVIKHNMSYGHERDLWELGVLTVDQDGVYDLCYDTKITNDVLGYLTDDQVNKTLGEIQKL